MRQRPFDIFLIVSERPYLARVSSLWGLDSDDFGSELS